MKSIRTLFTLTKKSFYDLSPTKIIEKRNRQLKSNVLSIAHIIGLKAKNSVDNSQKLLDYILINPEWWKDNFALHKAASEFNSNFDLTPLIDVLFAKIAEDVDNSYHLCLIAIMLIKQQKRTEISENQTELIEKVIFAKGLMFSFLHCCEVLHFCTNYGRRGGFSHKVFEYLANLLNQFLSKNYNFITEDLEGIPVLLRTNVGQSKVDLIKLAHKINEYLLIMNNLNTTDAARFFSRLARTIGSHVGKEGYERNPATVKKLKAFTEVLSESIYLHILNVKLFDIKSFNVAVTFFSLFPEVFGTDRNIVKVVLEKEDAKKAIHANFKELFEILNDYMSRDLEFMLELIPIENFHALQLSELEFFHKNHVLERKLAEQVERIISLKRIEQMLRTGRSREFLKSYSVLESVMRGEIVERSKV